MSYELTFRVNAGREYVYGQKDALIVAASRGEYNARRATERRPEDFPDWDSYFTYLRSLPPPRRMRIRTWAEVAKCHDRTSVLLFRLDKPGEDDATASGCINHGLADLTISIQPLAADRSFVTVECLSDDVVPAMRELLREFAQRYPEADPDIGKWLSQPGPTYLSRDEARPSPGAAEDEAALLDAIPNERDRAIVRLWRQRHTAGEIGQVNGLSLSAATVTNILCRLRRDYGEEVVPYDRDRLRK